MTLEGIMLSAISQAQEENWALSDLYVETEVFGLI